MTTTNEHKTAQAHILAHTQEVGGPFVPRKGGDQLRESDSDMLLKERSPSFLAFLNKTMTAKIRASEVR